ncbi:MAG: hypothetical protein ACLQGV_03905 [Bryobacteraceae bacterium]
MRIAFWILMATGGLAMAAGDGPCDRACLNGFVDRYLAALVAHDPAGLPLAKTAKYTENGQTLKLGDGMWRVAGAIGKYKLYFADPASGGAGFFGVVEENGHPQILALRLKIQERRIDEMEAIVARTTPGAWANPDGLTEKPIFNESLAPGERRSRAEMLSITNSYFEGLEQATGKLTPFDPNCTRSENGFLTANNPAGNPIQKMTCGQQFDTGFSTFITQVRERRFPIVDEERGLVYATIFFDHGGGVKTVKMTNGTTFKVPPPYDTPYTFLIGELFKIKNGKIQQIEAVLLPVPYGMPSGWGAGEHCGRGCLEGFVDRYLDAVVAHDPSRLPMAKEVKFTENGQRLELGDGLWGTASARGAYKLYVADPDAGEAGFFGTIFENGTPAILAVRLKLRERKVTEIETLVARGEAGGAHGERGARNLEKMGRPNAVFLEPVPAAERANREELIKTANLYFSGLERNDGKGVYPFTEDCNRIENGEQTTNRPPAQSPGWGDVGAMGCKAQFESGFFHFVTRIRDRRFVVVDRERGLALAFVFFDHAGNCQPVKLPDGRTLPAGPSRPFTWEIAELFKIERGKIRQVEAVLDQCPYGMTSGWSGWEEGMSSRARDDSRPLSAP